jgi:hypothetical protein
MRRKDEKGIRGWHGKQNIEKDKTDRQRLAHCSCGIGVQDYGILFLKHCLEDSGDHWERR